MRAVVLRAAVWASDDGGSEGRGDGGSGAAASAAAMAAVGAAALWRRVPFREVRIGIKVGGDHRGIDQLEGHRQVERPSAWRCPWDLRSLSEPDPRGGWLPRAHDDLPAAGHKAGGFRGVPGMALILEVQVLYGPIGRNR
jgi:hypothetical protein